MDLSSLRRWPWYAWAGLALAILAVFVPVVNMATSRSGMGSSLFSRQMVENYGISGASSGLAVFPQMAADMDYAKSEEPARSAPPMPAPTAGETAAEVDQKIIKTASLDLQVEDVPTATRRATELATERGGFVQGSSVSENNAGRKYGSVTVRVPAEKFEDLLGALRSLAKVVRNESVSGQDVTEQYTDLAARLKNAKAQEATYLAVLAQAKSVEDILKVQRYLGDIRESIERYEGQMKYLTNRTSYSTVSISFSEEPSVPVPGKEFRPGTAVREAWRTLVALAQALVIFAIWFVIVGGALLLPLLLVIWLVVKLIKRLLRPAR
jgi:hypothetical protein